MCLRFNKCIMQSTQLFTFFFDVSYDELKVLGRSRITALEHSRRRHALTRECDDLMIWMEECKTLAETYNMQVENDDDEDSLEQVEKLQKKLDDFQKVQ